MNKIIANEDLSDEFIEEMVQRYRNMGLIVDVITENADVYIKEGSGYRKVTKENCTVTRIK